MHQPLCLGSAAGSWQLRQDIHSQAGPGCSHSTTSFVFGCIWWCSGILGSAQASLPVLCSGITPGSSQAPYGLLGIKAWSAAYKADVLSAVLPLRPLSPLLSQFPPDLPPRQQHVWVESPCCSPPLGSLSREAVQNGFLPWGTPGLSRPAVTPASCTALFGLDHTCSPQNG